VPFIKSPVRCIVNQSPWLVRPSYIQAFVDVALMPFFHFSVTSSKIRFKLTPMVFIVAVRRVVFVTIEVFSLTSFGVFAAFLYNTTDSCDTVNQYNDLLPVPPLNVSSAFFLNSSDVLIRYIENLQYLTIHLRDKETGEFMSDEYLVWRILHFSGNSTNYRTSNLGNFLGFSSPLRHIGEIYEIDGFFETGVKFTVQFEISKFAPINCFVCGLS
jgi:hypothetical protein